MKTRKSISEEKVLGFSLTSLFPPTKREAVTKGGTSGAGIVKGWEEKQDCGRIPDTFT